MHYDYCIVGGGLGGVVCAAWLRANKPKTKIAMFEPAQIGNSLNTGGFKHLRGTPDFTGLLDSLGIKYTLEPIRGAILSKELDFLRYPEDVVSDIENIQKLHYEKTRGTLEGFTTKCMNWGGKSVDSVIPEPDMVNKMLEGVDIYQEGIHKLHLSGGSSYFRSKESGVMMEFGNVIWTPHIMFLQMAINHQYRCLEWSDCRSADLKIIKTIIHPEMALSQSYSDWDYLYTPHMVGVHRISSKDDGYYTHEAEWNDRGEIDINDVIYGLFTAGFIVDKIPSIIKTVGHLLPLPQRTKEMVDTLTHSGVSLVGRFSEWNHRMTIDQNPTRMEQIYGK